MATKQKKIIVNSDNFSELLLNSVKEGVSHTNGNISLRESISSLAMSPPEYSSTAIKKLRSKFNLTQELLAQLLGVKSSAVKHWEQGLRRPSATVRRLLQIIQTDPNILVKIAS